MKHQPDLFIPDWPDPGLLERLIRAQRLGWFTIETIFGAMASTGAVVFAHRLLTGPEMAFARRDGELFSEDVLKIAGLLLLCIVIAVFAFRHWRKQRKASMIPAFVPILRDRRKEIVWIYQTQTTSRRSGQMWYVINLRLKNGGAAGIYVPDDVDPETVLNLLSRLVPKAIFGYSMENKLTYESSVRLR